jgi:hypothetical protein
VGEGEGRERRGGGENEEEGWRRGRRGRRGECVATGAYPAGASPVAGDEEVAEEEEGGREGG